MGYKFQPKQSSPTHRYVVRSETQGIYLGDDNWSLKNPNGKDSAPTYTYPEGIDVLERSVVGNVPDVTLNEVWPDRDEQRASIDACAASGLPSWNPHVGGR